MTLATLVVLCLGAAALVAAHRGRWLTLGAVAAGALVGVTVLAGAGPGACLVLLVFFISSSLLTRWRGSGKTVGGREHGPGPSRGRDAAQVAANGGAAAVFALASLAGDMECAAFAVAGALAAATADSWATEVGLAVSGPTRLIVTWERVLPGRSGGVSAAGTIAGVVGALLVGLVAWVSAPLWRPVGLPSPGLLAAALGGGISGLVLDSLLGATLEGRWELLGNDGVNALATMAGGIAGCLLAGGVASLG